MAKRAVKIALNSLFGLFVCLALSYSVCMRMWPEETAAAVGYRFYTVVTGSMEPTIPTTSVVLTRCLKEGETPQPGQILTFRADRLGEEIVLTHYLREVKPDETGRVRFYTQGENADRYDDYATYREDLIGTYVLHIPYLGKIQAFLISSNALSMFVIVGLILAVYKLMLKNMDLTEQLQAAQLRPGVAGPATPETEPEPRGKRRERRHARPKRKKGPAVQEASRSVRLHGTALERVTPGTVRFSGEVENTGDAPLEALLLEVRLLDGHGRQVGTGEVLLAGGALAPAERRAFCAEWKADPLAASYAVKVRREPQPAAECAAVG